MEAVTATQVRDKIVTVRNEISSKILARIWDEYPELKKEYSIPDIERCKEDIGYHLLYLADAVGVRSSELFLHYTAWVKSLFESIGVPNTSFLASLRIIRDELQLLLPQPEFDQVLRIIGPSIDTFSSIRGDTESFIAKDGNYYGLANQYLDALLQGDRNSAVTLIMEAAGEGVPVKDIYLHIFQPIQHELGRLWQLNKISVAQEHYCTAVTQLIMSRLYPYIFSSKKSGTVFIGTCVGDELHEIGIRMLTDFLEMDGWDTYFLGANTPPAGVVSAIQEYKAHIVGISVTMIYHVHKAEELIHTIRTELPKNGVKILVGGYPFNKDRNLWREIGADGYASNAEEAIEVGKRLTDT